MPEHVARLNFILTSSSGNHLAGFDDDNNKKDELQFSFQMQRQRQGERG